MSKKISLAPLVLFAYNRPENTQKTLEALERNDSATDSNLFIFADGVKDPSNAEEKSLVDEVNRVVNGRWKFKSVEVLSRDYNYGLASNIISGVSEVIERFERVIVLEDDLVTSKHFINFMNKCLMKYEMDAKIMSIGGWAPLLPKYSRYKKDVYLTTRGCSWGWGTWYKSWIKADWELSDFESFSLDNKAQEKLNRGGTDLTRLLRAAYYGDIDSWAIKWDYSHYKNNSYCLRPCYSLIENIGFGANATHTKADKPRMSSHFTNDWLPALPGSVKPNKILMQRFATAMDGRYREEAGPIKRSLGRIIKYL
ncbi:MAG: glycosyltransferase [Cytophagales bacterium]